MHAVTTCFMIDDDSDDQEIFALALEEIKQNVTCFFANDGIEALKKLETNHSFIPDFIFLDLNMPRMNGKQCLAEIKKIDHLKHVPVIVYSTSSDSRFIDETRKLGAADYFTKPSSIRELTQKLTQLLTTS